MTRIVFDPFRAMERLAKQMDTVLGSAEKPLIESGNFSPRVEIIELQDKYIVTAELPGVLKENISININEERLLVIKGEKNKVDKNDNTQALRTERLYGKFERQFILPEDIDIENVSAKFELGILELTIPSKEPEKPKEINISII